MEGAAQRLEESELLSNQKVRAVAVETEVRDLVPTALRCIRAGKHIHLDKPAGASMADCRQLHAEANARSLVVQMGYMLRYNPGVQFAFRAVREGWLGDVFEVHAVMSKTIGDGSRKTIAEFEGGAMFELGCHLIDSVVAMLGKPDKVIAFPKRTRSASGAPSADNLADNCLAVLEYGNATATIRTALMEVSGQARRQITVCGDKGTVDIRPLEPPQLRLALAEPREGYKKGYQDVELPASPGRYDGEFLDLAQILSGKKEPDFSRQHDLDVHETVLRASAMPV